jgi:hypothetical protein
MSVDAYHESSTHRPGYHRGSMRVVFLLLALCLAACGSGGTAGDPEARIRVRLENHDPHLYEVASVDLYLERDHLVVVDRLAAPAGRLLEFPVEVMVQRPSGTGPLLVVATPRSSGGEPLGEGETRVTNGGAITAVTVALFSDRNSPSRGRMGAGPDGGGGEDAGRAVPDAAMLADAAQDVGAPPDLISDACTPRTHHLIAQAVISLDYGSVPRDREDSRVSVSSGFSHEHVHDFVGWMRFDLSAVPAGARLTSASVSLVLSRPPQVAPRLAIVYSASDNWDPATLTSDLADEVVRTARVSEDLGLPHSARASYPLAPELYAPFFAADLNDGAVTLGMISTTAPMEPESWADFYGLDPPETAPALDLVTCEPN